MATNKRIDELGSAAALAAADLVPIEQTTTALRTTLGAIATYVKTTITEMTAARVKTLYETNANSNEYDDAEQTKLAGIETSADVTDATNVTSAGAHMSAGTDVPVTDGGTGSSTASAARTALGLAIGTDVLPELAVVSTVDAEAGTATDERIWTAERVAEAIAALETGGSSMVLISSVSASESTTVDFTSGIDSTYDHYIITIASLVPGADAKQLLMRTTTDASNFDTTAGDYNWVTVGRAMDSSDLAGDSGASAVSFPMTQGTTPSDDAGATCNAVVQIYDPSSTLKTHVEWCVSWTDTAAAFNAVWGSGQRGAAENVDGVRFLMASDTIASGEFHLYGIKKS